MLRNGEGTAIIGDPRNDSHVLMSQMHLAFVHAHNALVDRARADGIPEPEIFETASRELRWHYQTAILTEFLPSLVGEELVETLLRDGPRFYQPAGRAYIPLEFADAAYRYGHSQIRHTYTLNSASKPAPIFPDLIGFRPVTPEQQVEWSNLFDAPGQPPAARAKKIDGRLVSALIALPVALTGNPRSRNSIRWRFAILERGEVWACHQARRSRDIQAKSRSPPLNWVRSKRMARRNTALVSTCCAKPTSDVVAIGSVRSARGLSARCLSVSWIWTRHPCVTRPKIGSRSFRSFNC